MNSPVSNFLVLCAVSLLFATCQAAEPASELLWPKGAPGAKGEAPPDKPEITIHLPVAEKANGSAVVICPGGGYGGLMMSYEGHDIAKWLNAQGTAGIVLKYRIAPYHHPIELNDAKRAMRTIRYRAVDLMIDPDRIGIMGFSAGGHLAATLGTHFDDGDQASADPIERMSSRPGFMLLVYPVISMGPKGHGGSRTNLLGNNPTQADIDLLSNEKQVTEKTPPAFLVHSKLDKAVPFENSAMFHEALKAKGIATEYLELATGDHGLGCGNGELWMQWQAKCLEWMKAQKIMDVKKAPK